MAKNIIHRTLGAALSVFTAAGLTACSPNAHSTSQEMLNQSVTFEYKGQVFGEAVLCAPKLFPALHEPGMAGAEIRGEVMGMAPIPQWLSFETKDGFLLAKIVCQGQVFGKQGLDYETEPEKFNRFTAVYWVDNLSAPTQLKVLKGEQDARVKTDQLKISYAMPAALKGDKTAPLKRAASDAIALKRKAEWFLLRTDDTPGYAVSGKNLKIEGETIKDLDILAHHPNDTIIRDAKESGFID